MKAILIRAQGGRENLRLEEIEKPSPDSGEILVKVKACSLNYLDIFVRRGMPGLPVDLPRIGGGDIAGEIEETILTLTPADIVKGRVTLDIKTALLARTNHLQVNGRVCLSIYRRQLDLNIIDALDSGFGHT